MVAHWSRMWPQRAAWSEGCSAAGRQNRFFTGEDVADDAGGVDVAGLEEAVPGGIVELGSPRTQTLLGIAHGRAGLEHRVGQDLPAAHQPAHDAVARVQRSFARGRRGARSSARRRAGAGGRTR